MAAKRARGPQILAEPTHKRIRATLGGHVVIDSTSVLLVWERPEHPQYYVPVSDVAARLSPAEPWEPPGGFGAADRFDVTSPFGVTAKGAAWSYPDIAALAEHLRFEWDAFEVWFEEDETVFVHPRSPYVRIDCLRSSRDIRIDVDGTTVAHSDRATILFETGFPPRYYLPPTDVRLDVLRRSRTTTSCPYKGEAEHLSVEVDGTVHEDLVWFYPTPLAEAAPIAGMLAFHTERCRAYVDGVREGNGWT